MFIFPTSFIAQSFREIERTIEKTYDYEIFHSILSNLYHSSFLLMLERKELVLAKQYLFSWKRLQELSSLVQEFDIRYRFYQLLLQHLATQNEMSQQMDDFFYGLKMIGAKDFLAELLGYLEKYEAIYSMIPSF